MHNIEKHNVSFEVAQEVFIGNDGNGIVTIRFTMRNGNIRILGAGYWREVRYIYEQKKSSLQ
jgi:uncharacterized DUF497 family protein